MKLRLGRRYRFHAAHRLHQPGLDATANEWLFGACNRLHGHDMALWVTVAGEVPAGAHRIVDPAALDAVVATALAPLDHARLDTEVPGLAGAPATAEATLAHLHRELAPAVAALGVDLAGLELTETAKNRFETERTAA